MANWIRVEKSTPYKQEIAEIARALHISTHEAFVRCFLVWSWADTESVDGFLKGIDLYGVDGVAGRRGFADVMVKVGWLAQRSDGVGIPDFAKHMGSSQKKRDRQRRWREKKQVDASETPTETVTSLSTSVFGLTESQERRESPDKGGVQGGCPVPTVEQVAQRWCFDYRGTYLAERNPYKVAETFREWVEKLGVTLPQLMAAVEDKSRDRTEPNFELKKRLCGKQAGASQGLGPRSRVSASAEKLALYRDRTIRVDGSAPDDGSNGQALAGHEKDGRQHGNRSTPGRPAAGGG